MNLSIIIPMHNAEQSITAAIASVYQALGDRGFEVIVIDDASTDNSVAVVTALQAHYQELILLKVSDNQGAGHARNVGLEAAQGEYLTFLDADDHYLGTALGDVLQLTQQHDADVSLFSYQVLDSGGNVSERLLARDNEVWQYLRPQCDRICTLTEASASLRLAGFPWNKMIKKSYADSIGLQFSETMVLNDSFVHFQSLLAAQRMLLLNTEVVAHHYEPSTQQLTNVHDIRRISSLVVLDQLASLYQAHPDYVAYLPFLYAFEDDIYTWMFKHTTPEFKDFLAEKYLALKQDRQCNIQHQIKVSNKKILVYGLGWKMMEYLDAMSEHNQIVGFMDSDLLKAGKTVFGYEIFHPLQKHLPEFDLIVICSSFEQEIKNNIQGVSIDKIKSVNDIVVNFII
ncbi:glycosyltransferase family A protein [Shewanella sp. NIFS-20-20]|uniref:glycosyltransferase family 2 protein n=1 Tax=Shewanella sp. NIFS-20-20 TaxID=2853806 RepID=UPI001C445F94|nr:glycosyltransferase family A protein [Shewanella sp. NIFS-20-20]MBV7316380.1 glycosyltransferase [Shewanella sp. NIFS-20-20]